MAINVISRKFWNQLINGSTFGTNPSDYTDYLQGSICEKIKVETTVDVYWMSQTTQYVDTWTIVGAGASKTLSRTYGSFLTDGFNVGDTIYFDAWFGVSQYTGTGTITGCNDLTMLFTVNTGSLSPGNPYPMTIYGTTTLSAIIFKFNLIENEEADNFTSKVDGNTISYAGSGLNATDTLLTKQGSFNSQFDGGTVNVKTGSSGVAYTQRFIITHEFYVTPFYLPDQYNDLQDGIAPSFLKDLKSLKYIANYDLKASLYNPNSSHATTDSLQLGDVSWFDEHFNGFTPVEFSKDSIAYSVSGVAVTELQVNDITHVTIEINSANNLFVSGNRSIVNLFMLPIDDADYKNTLTTMFENYVFDRCYQTVGGGAASGDNGIMTNLVTSIVSNKLHIEFDVTFTTAQKSLIADHQYIISVLTDQLSATHATSKEVNVLCDYTDFGDSVDNPDLLSLTSCKYFEHPVDPTISGTGTKDYKGWITDGVYNETAFAITGGTLNYLKFKVRAYNSVTLEEFDLMLFNLDLSSYPVISNERIVSINSTRGFKLITGSIQNLVYLANTTANNYLLKFGFKLRWEDWVQLLEAHQDFYNSALTNNGLSQKWSNYDDIYPAWTLQILQVVTVEDVLTGFETDFDITSSLRCHNFAEDGNTPALWSGSIETFEDATSLGVDNSALYSSTKDTKIVATFTSTNAITTSDLYGLIYIEQYQQGGIYNQWQLSTEDLPAINNWLKPVTGQTKCKLTIVDLHTVTLEAMIDYTKVTGNISIAARIGAGCEDIAEVRASDIHININPLAALMTRSVDITINGVPISVGGVINPPYTASNILAQIGTLSGGYEFTIA